MRRISIIIPVKPGGPVAALAPVRLAEYPSELFDVVVAEGRRPSLQRNFAAEQVAGEILYFLDDDSLIDSKNLLRITSHFADPDVAAVGGPSLTPPTDGKWQRSFGVVFSSLFGGGGVRNRYRRNGAVRETDDRELILCNLAFRADLFRNMGGFDERLYPNEENELLDRIIHAGKKILHDPDMIVFRSQRPTFAAFLRQVYGYGRGRGEQTRISHHIDLISLLPSLFFIYVCSLAIINYYPFYYLPLLCYALLVFGFSLYETKAAGLPGLIFRLLLGFPSLHLAYGVGMIAGLLCPRFRRRIDVTEVFLRKIK